MHVWKKLILAVVAVGCLEPVYAQSSMGGVGSSSMDEGSGRSSRRSSRSRSGSGSSGETADNQSRSRSERSRDRESNSRSSKRSSRNRDEDKAADAKATPTPDKGKDSKTVEGKKAPTKSKSGGGTGGREPIDIKFEMQADPETNIMYLEALGAQPSLNVSVLENKKFVTRLALYNPKSSMFSQIDASLKYDPQLVRPVGVDDRSVVSRLSNPARVLVDKNRGILSIAADLKEPSSDSFMTIAKIQWEALEPVASTPIAFLNTENHPSGVFNLGGENILHFRSDGTVETSANTGLLDATVSIEPTNGTLELAETTENPFSAVALATNINSGTAEGGIHLTLRPRKPTVRVGEDFLVDIFYQNPKRADMDTVKLKLRFDPEVLQVEDYDEGNWITRDINIFDGDYHDALPFDYHRKNVVFNNLGLINYENGFGSRTPIPEEGVIATIRFRAITPSLNTPIVFSKGDESAIDPDTAISFLGFNLIGKPGSRDRALSSASISVAN